MIEDLNKTQLILLTLLLSFVTSIATGIITATFLQEAPQNVTQTINRVVEKTIEKVVPAEVGGTEKVREVTVVVKEEDLVIDAIDKNTKSLVRIKDTALIDGVGQFYGIGFLVDKNGLVLSGRRENISTATTYIGTLADGTAFPMKVVSIDETAGLAYFQIAKDAKAVISGVPAVFATKDLQLGQTVIAIEGDAKNVVSIGRVISFGFGSQNPSDPSSKPTAIETDIKPKTNIYGGPLVNLSGEIVGLRASQLASGTNGENYVSLSVIKNSLSANAQR